MPSSHASSMSCTAPGSCPCWRSQPAAAGWIAGADPFLVAPCRRSSRYPRTRKVHRHLRALEGMTARRGTRSADVRRQHLSARPHCQHARQIVKVATDLNPCDIQQLRSRRFVSDQTGVVPVRPVDPGPFVTFLHDIHTRRIRPRLDEVVRKVRLMISWTIMRKEPMSPPRSP